MPRATKRKKVNPRRKPATQADVEKAKNEAKTFALDAAIAICAMANHDVFQFGKIRMKRWWDYVESLSEDVLNGQTTIPEIQEALWNECGINLGGNNK